MNDIVYPRYRWVVIASLCGMQAMAVSILVAPATLIGEMADAMVLAPGETLAAVMVFRELFVMVSAFTGGILIDRFGPYRVWAGGAVFLILGSLLVPVCGSSLFGMLVIRALHGMGAGPIFATAPLVVAQWAPSRERGIILGVQGTFVSIGAAVSMVFVPAVFHITGSWQTALAGVSLFAFAALGVSLLVVRGPKPPTPLMESPVPGRSSSGGRDFARVLVMPVTWAAVSCSFCFGWTIRIVYDIIPSYLTIEQPLGIGMSQMAAGKIMSGLHLFSIAAALSSGFLMERFFRGRARGLVMIGFFLGAFSWLAVWLPEPWSGRLTLSLCMWVGGFGLSLTNPLLLAFISKGYSKDCMGTISGVITGAGALGTLTGLSAGTFALQKTGSYGGVLLLVCLGAILGFLSSLFLKDPKTEAGSIDKMTE
jgi:ACS family glucarate transporter-like MFS transporter